MSAAPLPLVNDPLDRLQTRRGGAASVRRAPTTERIRRRRWAVGLMKRLLPVVALLMLCCVALWPEIARDTERARMSFRRGGIETENGQVVEAHYSGVDERNRPYTVTAATAQQVTPERVNLGEPKGDVQLESGSWLIVQSHKGVYIQHQGLLDLSDEVTIYRDDGTTMQTSSATVDLKGGAAAGAEMVHVEGPFGTLDAQGFSVTDRGASIHFSGPGRLVMNGANH